MAAPSRSRAPVPALGGFVVREAIEADLPKLSKLERAAARAFRDLGMDVVADDEPPSLEVPIAYAADRRALVLVDERDEPVAYVLTDVVDGTVHIEQVSVDPRYARRQLGSALIDAVAERARAQGSSALTLTAFAHVPWNAPYYRRLGFADVASRDQPRWLRAIRKNEAARGLDRWPRVAMRRELAPLARTSTPREHDGTGEARPAPVSVPPV